MTAIANIFGRERFPGRDGLARVVVGAALMTVAAGTLAPAEVSAHAGEVHSDATEAAAPINGSGGNSDHAKGGAGEKKTPSRNPGGVRLEESGEAGTTAEPASSPAPVPEEPDSDPMLHFAALGVVVVAGLGLLLVRRRRLET